jgi:hypothetical protein
MMFFTKFHATVFVFLLVSAIGAFAQEKSKQLRSSSHADTWAATDAMGRSVTMAAQNGTLRKDRYVGIFYMIWQGAHGYDTHRPKRKDEGVQDKLASDTISPYDISKLLAANPEHPNYGPDHAFHYWGEPYFGYYLPDDEWVIRKHAQMLSDAGVDVLIMDVTNATIYLPQVTKIAETYTAMRKEGKSTPDFTFIVNSAPEKTVERLYENIYKKDLFKDLWFYWKGKPLLLCPPEALTDTTRNFFSSRQSWAWSKGQKWFADGLDKWTWVDHTPQSYGWHESKDKAEQISVAIAEHPTSNIGRSFHNGTEPEVKRSGEGLYFSEQWEQALKVDPEFVFVTGWNEWVAMRFINGRAKNMLGKPIDKGETYFVDLYNAEYSRDAEPVKGAFNDNYYYQLVDNIRKYKGARAVPVFTSTNKIAVDGKFNDWQKVEAVFADDEGDTFHRKHPGWGRIKEYTNTSGRNDIITAKITSDKKYVYFYVQTAQPLTPREAEDWMQLYIKIDAARPSWEGFNFLINHRTLNDNISNIEYFTPSGNWENAAPIDFRTNKNELELAVPKKILGITGNIFTLDFKWTDNIPANGNAMLWLDQGDTAPNARFRYRYVKQ